MGIYDIIKVVQTKAPTEAPKDSSRDEGASTAPIKKEFSIASKEAPRPEITFTSHSNVKEEPTVVFTPVTSSPNSLAPSTRDAGRSYVEEMVVDYTKSIVNGSFSSDLALDKETAQNLVESGVYEIDLCDIIGLCVCQCLCRYAIVPICLYSVL